MTATMRLTAEGCAATFDPADGGRLASFRVGDHELLAAQRHDVFHSGSFVMAPWAGRLRDARLNYGGAQYRFTANKRAARLARAGYRSAVAGHRRQ